MNPDDKIESNFIENGSDISISEPQPNTPAVPASTSNVTPAPNGSILNGGSFYSPNFSKGNAGWAIDAAGNAEFNDGNFRGDITGATGTFTGAVAASQLDIGGDDATSFHVDSGGGIWSGAAIADKATAPFRVSNAGVVVATSITATGTINATGGYLGAPTTVLNISTSGLDVGVTGHFQGGASDYLTGTGFFLGYSGAAYKFSVGNPAGNYIGWDGTTLTIVGNQVVVTTYTSGSGTWTKATGTKTVFVQAWGGGGAGGGVDGNNGSKGGGGGGAYVEYLFNAADLGATEAYAVGAGATGGTGTGSAGGNTTFDILTAYGGGGGAGAGVGQEGGGGGAGVKSVGANSTSATGGDGGTPIKGTGGTTGNAGTSSVFGGGGGSGDANAGGESVMGGGGGAGGNGSGAGGDSWKGGAGGGGGKSGGGTAGGTSVYGGNGGAGGNASVGTDGVAPGGGGGGAHTAAGASFAGGSGGSGRLIITEYK